MARVRDMQGVPAHLETLHTNDRRRNKAHCIHSEHTGNRVYICHCQDSGYREKACGGSSRCAYYVDKRE